MSRISLMYDDSVSTPSDGQIFVYDSATESVIPASTSIGGIIAQSGSGTGIGDVLVASFAIPDSSIISISGIVNVISDTTSTNFDPGDSATWSFTSGGILVNYDTGASYVVRPTNYQQGTHTAYPQTQYRTGAGDFDTASLYVVCASNAFYLYFRPDQDWDSVNDSWLTKCSLHVTIQAYA